MNTLKTTAALMLASMTLFAGAAFAKPVAAPTPAWVEYVAPTSPITINWINGVNSGTSTVSYSPAALDIWAYDANIADQSTAHIKSIVESKFGLAANSLNSVLSCNVPGSCATGGDGIATAGTFTSTNAFNYLAVHYGNGELLFKFAAPQTSFTISGLHNGLSSFQAFTTAVPEPSDLLMMISGLGLMGMMVRRRKNQA